LAAEGAVSVGLAALRLGCSSFGGPIAHLGYFEREYVQQRRWVSSDEFTGIVAVCQMLPGPTSSQVGFLIGWHRAGWRGAMAAWLGFTLPSALLMYAFAVLAPRARGPVIDALLQGFKLAAVAVVAQAVWNMARRLCPDLRRASIAIAAGLLLLWANSGPLQLVALLGSGLAGFFLCQDAALAVVDPAVAPGSKTAVAATVIFLALLAGLPLLAAARPHGLVALVDMFYRAGALVFGGGQVVLPLLRDALVPGGWVTDAAFLNGFGAAQGLPGPQFTLAAYLGAMCAVGTVGAAGDLGASAATVPLWSAVAVVCIFLPGMLLAVAALWLRRLAAKTRHAGAVLAGLNAGVVGILGAAFYNPVWTTAIHTLADIGIAAIGFLLLERLRLAPLAVVAIFLVVSLIRAA
jgi:chromate transporter